MPLFLGNTYSSREKGTGGLQLLSKTQRNYAYINMWIERNKKNGDECKQWVNLVKAPLRPVPERVYFSLDL